MLQLFSCKVAQIKMPALNKAGIGSIAFNPGLFIWLWSGS